MKLSIKALTILSLFVLAACTPAAPVPAATSAPTVDLGAVQTLAVGTLVMQLTQDAAANPPADLNAVRTEAAATAQAEFAAQLTQNAPVDPTPEPTATQAVATLAPQPTATNTRAVVVVFPTATRTPYTDAAELVSFSIPNYAVLPTGRDFDQTITIKNVGRRAWGSDFYLKYVSGLESPVTDEYFIGKTVAVNDTVAVTLDFNAPTTPGNYNTNWSLINDDGVSILSINFVFTVRD